MKLWQLFRTRYKRYINRSNQWFDLVGNYTEERMLRHIRKLHRSRTEMQM